MIERWNLVLCWLPLSPLIPPSPTDVTDHSQTQPSTPNQKLIFRLRIRANEKKSLLFWLFLVWNSGFWAASTIIDPSYPLVTMSEFIMSFHFWLTTSNPLSTLGHVKTLEWSKWSLFRDQIPHQPLLTIGIGQSKRDWVGLNHMLMSWLNSTKCEEVGFQVATFVYQHID